MVENCFIKISNVDFLMFMYPNYVKRDYISLADLDKNVIYVGEVFNGLREYLKGNTNKFISLVGIPDFDLTSRELLVKFVFDNISLNNKKLPDVKIFLNMSESEFFNWLKLVWVSGKIKIEEDDKKLFQFYKSFNNDVKDNLKLYLELRDNYSCGYIESSLLTFLDRVVNCKHQKVSGTYLKLLSQLNYQLKPETIRNVILNSFSKKLSPELRILDILLSLRNSV